MHAKRPVDWLGKLIVYKLGIFLVAGLFMLGDETIKSLIVLVRFLVIFYTIIMVQRGYVTLIWLF